MHIRTLHARPLDVKRDKVLEGLFRAGGDDDFWDRGGLVNYGFGLGVVGGAEEIGDDALHDAGAGEGGKVCLGLGQQGPVACAQRGERAAGDQQGDAREERQQANSKQ